MRSQNKIIFQLALVPIIDEVNSGINLLVFYFGKQRNPRLPLLWGVTDKVTGGARLVAHRLDAGNRVCPKQIHSYDRLRDFRNMAFMSAPGATFRGRITDRAQRKDR